MADTSKFCQTTDIRDELLKDVATVTDCIEADNVIYDLALSLGVSTEQIVTPTPYKVKALAIALSCLITARNKSIMNVRAEDGVDAYELKRQVYQKEVDRLMQGITADVLTGGASAPVVQFPYTIEVFRS